MLHPYFLVFKSLKLARVNNTIQSRQRVKWLERRVCDRHGLGSKPARATLLCPRKKHFKVHSPAWWS